MTEQAANRGWAFHAALVLMTASMLYFSFWAVMDVMARAGVWPDWLLGFSGADFIASITWLDETLFVTQGLCKAGAILTLLRGMPGTLSLQIGVIITGLWQWVLQSTNLVYDGSIDGIIFICVDLVAFGLLLAIRLRP